MIWMKAKKTELRTCVLPGQGLIATPCSECWAPRMECLDLEPTGNWRPHLCYQAEVGSSFSVLTSSIKAFFFSSTRPICGNFLLIAYLAISGCESVGEKFLFSSFAWSLPMPWVQKVTRDQWPVSLLSFSGQQGRCWSDSTQEEEGKPCWFRIEFSSQAASSSQAVHTSLSPSPSRSLSGKELSSLCIA